MSQDPPAPPLPPVPGFEFATAAARIRDWDRDDVAVAVATGPHPAAAAGLFTRSAFRAAPVKRCIAHLRKSGGRARAVAVNAGAANACTGRQGMADAAACAARVARRLRIRSEEVLLCSTGVIGRRLPMERLLPGLDLALATLDAHPASAEKAGASRPAGGGGLDAFARAIMTTDIRPKTAWKRAGKGGTGPLIAGACKGSGMIAPNMATLLAFLFTDAAISPPLLHMALIRAADISFNNVTVDGDTSTNDTLLALASGASGAAPIEDAGDPRFTEFMDAMAEVSESLAMQVARDGEGATKLVRVRVQGAAGDSDAKKAAKAIAESPLVKTALFGNDPNWGRILMAIGKSGAKAREERVAVSLCGVQMMRDGHPLPFDAAALSAAMRQPEIDLEVDLGLGAGVCAMLTCDFSYDYVRINADYTT